MPVPCFQLPVRARPAGLRAAVRYLVTWFVLVTPVAVAAGTAAALFLWSLDRVTRERFEHPWLLFLLPAAGLASAALYHRFGRSVEAGNNLLLDEIHEPGGGIPPRIVPLIFLTTVGGHLFGAPVGREGTAVQMGGGIAAAFARALSLSPARVRTLLMAGIAAGFGAVFGTPVAGAIFAIEVLAIGRFEYKALVPVLYAAFAADFTATAWGAHHTAYHIVAPGEGSLPFTAALLAKTAIAGIAFGLAALLFAEVAHGLAAAWRRAIPSPLLRPVVGGAVIIALVFIAGSRDYLGLGVTSPDPGATTIVSSFRPGGASDWAWWWKLLFTAVAVSSGFKGGEVTPLFFIGAALGNRLAALLDAPAGLFAGAGLAAVFAGAANTPLACTVMGIELFGAAATPYLAIACFASYLASGHSGIYLSQRIARPKPFAAHAPTLRAHRAQRSRLPWRRGPS
ncbi:MAG: chloride channel protein [Dehalococcoidia bacterium]